MKYTVVRDTPKPPPITEVVMTFTVEEFRVIYQALYAVEEEVVKGSYDLFYDFTNIKIKEGIND